MPKAIYTNTTLTVQHCLSHKTIVNVCKSVTTNKTELLVLNEAKAAQTKLVKF